MVARAKAKKRVKTGPRNKLPKKLSDVLEISIKDAMEVIRRKKAGELIAWDMGTYFSKDAVQLDLPSGDDDLEVEVCTICQAGATLLCRMGEKEIDDNRITPHDRSRLYAIDYVRRGDYTDAFESLGDFNIYTTQPDMMEKINNIEYHDDDNPEDNIAHFRRVIKILRKYGY